MTMSPSLPPNLRLQHWTKASANYVYSAGVRCEVGRLPRSGGRRALGMLGCWLSLYVLPPLLLFAPCPGVQPVVRSDSPSRTLVALAASQESESGDDPSSAELDRLKAQVEVAEARVAAAQAKAALAATHAGVGDAAGGVGGGGTKSMPVDSDASASAVVTAYSGDERRPALFFWGAEGSVMFDLMERLEDMLEPGNVTALDTILRGWFMSVYQFSLASRVGELDEAAPENVRRNVKELGNALDADLFAGLLSSREGGGDWRPFMRGLGSLSRLSDIMEDSLQWEALFPEAVVRSTGIASDESKARVLNFFRSSSFREAGTWTDAELLAAERLIAGNPRLRKVFARVEIIRESLSENIKNAVGAPILALVCLVAAIGFLCFGMSRDPNMNAGDAQQLVTSAGAPLQTDPQNLPLFKLEK